MHASLAHACSIVWLWLPVGGRCRPPSPLPSISSQGLVTRLLGTGWGWSPAQLQLVLDSRGPATALDERIQAETPHGPGESTPNNGPVD